MRPSPNYLLAQIETDSTKKYKGIHWARMRGQRTNFAGRQGPGPGEYDLDQDCKCKGESVDEEGERCKFESFIPRYTEQLVRDEIREVRLCKRLLALSCVSYNESGVLYKKFGYR